MDHSSTLVAVSSSPPCSSSSKPAIALPSHRQFISPLPLIASFTAAPAAGATTSFTSSSLSTTNSTVFTDHPHGRSSFGAAICKAAIVWFRNDLRVHDHEALWIANQESLSVLPVYCFDPRDFGKSSAGFDQTAPFRAKFLLECVSNLRDNLRERGSDLIVRVGKPDEVLVSLAKAIGADGLYVHQEVSCDEVECENKVSVALQEEGVDIKYFWGSTLFHMDDLPFELEEMPSTYSGFRERVEHINARKTLESPKWLTGLPVRGGVQPGDIPTLQDLGLGPLSAQRQEFPRLGVRTSDKSGGKEQEWVLDLFFRLNRGRIGKDDEGHTLAASSLIGGEVEALQRLKSFCVDHVKQSSNKVGNADGGDTLYGSNFYSQISPWLAMGCLSPRQMFEHLNNNEKMVVSASAESLSNDNGLNWLVFELLWRDFFRFVTKKSVVCKRDSEFFTSTASTAAVPRIADLT